MIDGIEARIKRAILAQKAKGITVCDRVFQMETFCMSGWRVKGTQACALECVLLEERPPRTLPDVYQDIDGALAHTLGIAVHEVWSIIYGFDNRSDIPHCKPSFFALGQRLRAEFIGEKNKS